MIAIIAVNGTMPRCSCDAARTMLRVAALSGGLHPHGARVGARPSVSIFRWLPQRAKAPTPNCLDFGLAKPPPSKRRFAGEDPRRNGRCPPARTAGRSNAYRRGRIMIDRGIPSLGCSLDAHMRNRPTILLYSHDAPEHRGSSKLGVVVARLGLPVLFRRLRGQAQEAQGANVLQR